jgi:hypothetical protein
MAWRYMQEWGHPIGDAGITYISTGMNVNMMNSARIQNLEYRAGASLIGATNSVCDLWEVRKARWAREARLCPTLEQYLNEKFYHEDTVAPMQDTPVRKSYISVLR